jgi:hypothetical protein
MELCQQYHLSQEIYLNYLANLDICDWQASLGIADFFVELYLIEIQLMELGRS